MRKSDGRWSKALITFDGGNSKTIGRPLIDWDHDIRNGFKGRYPEDHRTLQEVALNPTEWAGLRPIYAVDWQHNPYIKDSGKAPKQKIKIQTVIPAQKEVFEKKCTPKRITIRQKGHIPKQAQAPQRSITT